MTISTINNIVSSGLLSARPSAPALAAPGAGSNPSVIYLATDTGDTYMWDYGGSAWIKVNAGGGAALTLIQRVATTSGQTTLTISVPNTYQNLRIMINGNFTDTADGPVELTLNGDTGANYTETEAFCNTALGGSLYVNMITGGANFRVGIFGGTPGGSTAGQYECVIADYNGTTFWKSIRSQGGYTDVRGPLTYDMTGYWASTAAITSLTFTVTAAFVAGTVIEVYGQG